MRPSFRRCACGALLAYVTITGAVFHHDEETHADQPTTPVAQFTISGVGSSSSSARAVLQSNHLRNGVWYIST
jgi:hypothetical protein